MANRPYTEHEKFADDADAYLDKHAIYELFGEMFKELALKQPKDPYNYMIDLLGHATNTPKFCIVGPPGSGKEQQVSRMLAETQVIQVTMAGLIEAELFNGGPLAAQLKPGSTTVPDSVATELVLNRLKEDDCVANGWLLDGIPQSRSQAQSLLRAGIVCDKMLLLSLPREVSLRRAKLTDEYKMLPPEDIEADLDAYERHLQRYIDLFPDRAFVDCSGSEEESWALLKTVLARGAPSQAPRRPNRVIMLGPTGAGKATQCQKLAAKYGLTHISTGALLRQEMARSPETLKELTPYLTSGTLVPDEFVIPMVCRRLLQSDCGTKGWLLDGFPRTLAQADALVARNLAPNRVVVLEVSEQVALSRCLDRRVDPLTGDLYHMMLAPPTGPVATRCIQRQRDKEPYLKNIINAYNASSAALRETYQDCMKKITGEQDVEQVFKDIERFVLAPLKSGQSAE